MKIQKELKGDKFLESEKVPSAPLMMAGSNCCVLELNVRIPDQEVPVELKSELAGISFRSGDPARFHPLSSSFVLSEFMFSTSGTVAFEPE